MLHAAAKLSLEATSWEEFSEVRHFMVPATIALMHMHDVQYVHSARAAKECKHGNDSLSCTDVTAL